MKIFRFNVLVTLITFFIDFLKNSFNFFYHEARYSLLIERNINFDFKFT